MSLQCIPRSTRAQVYDVLSSMATLAGYRAVVEAAHKYPSPFAGQITAAGRIRPAQVRARLRVCLPVFLCCVRMELTHLRIVVWFPRASLSVITCTASRAMPIRLHKREPCCLFWFTDCAQYDARGRGVGAMHT